MSIFNIVIIVLFSISLCDVNVSLDLIDNKYIIINIGEPAQQLKFYVDTSSPINIIFERGCRGCTTDKQNYYPNRSKSLKKSHIYYELDTIFGNFKGHFSNEQFIFSNLVNFNLAGASNVYKCILITVQMAITPIVISGLVKGSDAITSRMF